MSDAADLVAAYADDFATAGEWVLVRRYTGTGANRPRREAAARAKVAGYDPQELVGGIVQGDQKVAVLAADLIAEQFPLPLRKDDKVVVRGKELNIEAADDATRRVGATILAIEIQARG